MKKALLGTSAVALATAFATAASAVEWEVRVGGYSEQFAAWASPDIDGLDDGGFDGIDNKSDTEIHFVPSITLDNGLKIGADVQLEGNRSGDQIDESFVFIDGAFGRVLAGSENSAGYLMHYGAPTVAFITNSHNSGNLGAFIPFTGTVTGTTGFGDVATLNLGDDAFRGTLYSTYLENAGNNDAQRFTYFTPRFAGFQLGVSYARDGREDNNQQLDIDLEEVGNIFDVGANYVNTFGAFDVAVSGRYGIATNDDDFLDLDDDEFFGQFDDNPQIWSAGLNLGFAGFTVGGSFAEQNNTVDQDGRSWDAGVSYETGPWGVSFSYLNGKNVDDENALINAGDIDGDGVDDLLSTGADEKLQAYVLAARYTLAKGVAFNAFGAYVDFDEDVGDLNIDTDLDGIDDDRLNPGGDDTNGWVVGTGIKISF